jgi:hypothetical protein
MTDQQKFNDYARFVDITTSATSKNTDAMLSRMDILQGTTSHKGEERTEEMQVARLLTSVIGMMAESGEFAEVVKKKIFQADTQFTENIKKLEQRYPNGFEVIRSEVRADGDI